MTRTLRFAWLAFLAGAGLILDVSLVGAQEQRCTELGSDCLCSEPLNTNTVDGGKPWSGVGFNCAGSTCHEDPDDSPGQCLGIQPGHGHHRQGAHRPWLSSATGGFPVPDRRQV